MRAAAAGDDVRWGVKPSPSSSSSSRNDVLGVLVLYKGLMSCHVACIALHSMLQRGLDRSEPGEAISTAEGASSQQPVTRPGER